MKNKLKKMTVGCLFAITALLLSNGCTNPGNSQSNQKIIKDYYVAYK